MKHLHHIAFTITIVCAFALGGCNTSGLAKAPRATFSQLACLDVNGDNRLDSLDAAESSELPDFNADRARDKDDAAYLYGLDIPLDPARDTAACTGDAKKQPEYLVAHGYLSASDVSCGDSNDEAVLLLGIGGGVVNLRDDDDAAGVRSIIDGLQRAYEDRDVQTIGVISGQAIGGAVEPHAAMEHWLTHAVQVYLERFPCLKVVVVGHSHGGVIADVIGARLETEYADRITAIVVVDRVEDIYAGDIESRPMVAPVFNVYEANDARFRTEAFEAPNYENWDASAEEGPKDGDKGGAPEPVNHTTIDNSSAVKERIIDEVLGRS